MILVHPKNFMRNRFLVKNSRATLVRKPRRSAKVRFSVGTKIMEFGVFVYGVLEVVDGK